MELRKEFKILAWIITGFAFAFFLPIESARFNTAIAATLDLVKWYAREHFILCLLPAFFIAGVIPNEWISALVGGNSVFSNFFSSIVGAFMYFATLTEVPIVQGLLAAGMGKGPALALLLAGPSLSLPSMLVIRKVMGTQKTVIYVTLVVIFSTIAGLIFGVL